MNPIAPIIVLAGILLGAAAVVCATPFVGTYAAGKRLLGNRKAA